VKAIFLLLTHVLYSFLHLFLLPNQGCRRDDITQESNSLDAPKKIYKLLPKEMESFVILHNMVLLGSSAEKWATIWRRAKIVIRDGGISERNE